MTSTENVKQYVLILCYERSQQLDSPSQGGWGREKYPLKYTLIVGMPQQIISHESLVRLCTCEKMNPLYSTGIGLEKKKKKKGYLFQMMCTGSAQVSDDFIGSSLLSKYCL